MKILIKKIKTIIKIKNRLLVMSNDTIIRVLVTFYTKMKECEEDKKKKLN